MTKMQKKFTLEYAKEILRILYPELDTTEFIIKSCYPKYTWICIEAYRRPKYNPDVLPEDRLYCKGPNCSITQKSMRLAIGIDNHYTGAKYFGEISKSEIDPKDIEISIWKFYNDDTLETKLPQDLKEAAIKYLNSVRIHPANVSEYYKEYNKD